MAAALRAELEGDSATRTELAAKARAIDSTSHAARWQNGQVFYDGAWRTLDEIHEVAGQNERLREYRDLRRDALDDVPGNLTLARWCAARGLEGQARFHWAKVLWLDPANPDARNALGLYEYRGGLYTSEQIADIKRQSEQADKDFDRYLQTFRAWLRDAASDDTALRETALAKFRNVRDPLALPALEYVAIEKASERRGVVARLGKTQARELRRELCLAVVAAMAAMPEHASTLRLVDFAVFNVAPEIRKAAAEALRPRKKTDYVPQLMGALSAPVVADIQIATSPDGTVSLGATFDQAGPTADRRLTRSRDVVPYINFDNRRPQRITTVVARSHAQAERDAAAAQAAVEKANRQGRQLNQRIQEVLAIAADVDQGANAKALWQEWFDYNELYSESHPVIEDNVYYTEYSRPMSCFIAGTPVWTETGPRPIERIMPGDLVLAQHPETGELAYRPVMQTTVRPPSQLVTLDVDGETIATTRGHRFWVNGQGWEMAKFLEPRMRLHALDRGAEIASVGVGSESEAEEAYNLVVEGFHTYFVGESRLLVCDNSCPQPTLAVVPGLLNRRTHFEQSATRASVER